MRPTVPAVLLSVVAAVGVPAHAAESYDSCKFEITSLPAVLTTQGVWCLKGDVASNLASGTAITLAANNITLDCNGFKVGGLSAGPATIAAGIGATSRNNAVVRGCNVRGFFYGLHFVGVAGATIEDNVFESNTFTGVLVEDGLGTIVRRNRISDTGGTDNLSVNSGVGLRVEGSADIIDNLIDGVGGPSWSTAYNSSGIETSNLTGSIQDNRIRGLAPLVPGTAIGIFNGASFRLTVERNVVDTGAVPNSIGIRCSNSNGVAAENRLLGAVNGVMNCASVDNHIDVD